METPNYRKASIYFDDETVLEVTQRGGGGSGVGGETGLEAVNLKTGESTNAALAAKDETIEEQAATIEQLQEELANVPTIEALNVTANGTYSEDGKAYSPVNVNVPSGYVSGFVDATSIIEIVNNTNFDIHYPDIPEVRPIAPATYDSVNINIITVPAGGSARLTVTNKGFYVKPGKSWRYALRQLEDLSNNTVTDSTHGLVTGNVTATKNAILLSSSILTPYFNATVTIS